MFHYWPILLALVAAKPHDKNPDVDVGVAVVTGGVTSVQCGQANMTSRSLLSTYIVGGLMAPRGSIPWQVGLYRRGSLICGGSYVVNPDGKVRVITAAHCVTESKRRYSVRFGLHDKSLNDGVLVYPSDIVSHSQYDDNTMENDIAVLTFDGVTPAHLSTYGASPICLASTGYKADELGLVSGWGTTSEGGSMSRYLQYVFKPLVDYDNCNKYTGNAGSLHESMFCAADAGKDACQGDSGGPLAVERNDIWELVGVVSWGYGCARDNFPGVYTDVNYLRTWILGQI